MLDLQVFGADLVTATLTELPAIADTNKYVQNRPNPRLSMLHIAGEGQTDYAYLKTPSMGQLQSPVGSAANQSRKTLGKLTISELMQAYGYQSSGGNLKVFLGALLGYGKQVAYRPGKSVGLILTPTAGAEVWGALTQSTGLDASKTYQIEGFQYFDADGLFARFDHPDFEGLHPGGSGTLVYQQNTTFKIPKKDLPTFRGSVPLGVSTMAIAAAAGTVVVYLNEL